MRMKNRLGVMFLCLTFRTSATQCGLVPQQRYHLLSEFNNLNMTNAQCISELKPRTLLTCARACLDTNNCTMFNINNNDGQCLLFSATFLSEINSSPLDGARMYGRVSDTCPLADGYVTFDNPTACYRLSLVRKTWMDAKADCEGDGGHLVVLEDVDKQQQVMEATAAIRDTEAVFVGLGDIDADGKYVWVDGRDLVNPFWDSGEPTLFGNKHCAVLYNHGLHASNCDIPSYYMCQIDTTMMVKWKPFLMMFSS
ncbi:macrophage mannose receptor 1-like [Haliotis rufescens]|uniref:macrophage mannose receptor 1-like n=1 Tax=Haliotis rufescens TaxID=6454 RepID=UPI00201FB201|nr:macrophage mannose receptor 1-like [Haliotis rufescens]